MQPVTQQIFPQQDRLNYINRIQSARLKIALYRDTFNKISKLNRIPLQVLKPKNLKEAEYQEKGQRQKTWT